MTRLACALLGAVAGSAALVVWAELPELRRFFREGGKVTEVVRW